MHSQIHATEHSFVFYEEASLRAEVPAQCLQLCFADTQELLPALESVEVVDQLVSVVGVHEGTQLIVSALVRASQWTEVGELGLPARVVTVATAAHSRAMAVAELRRRRLGLEATASEEDCAQALSQAVPTRLVYSLLNVQSYNHVCTSCGVACCSDIFLSCLLLLQHLQFYLTVNCHQAKAKLARDAAALQLRYPDLKEYEALVRLGLRYADTVRARLY